jgi:hypothetical protein
MSETLKRDILRAGSDDNEIAKKATRRVVKEIRKDPAQRYLMGTSQAVDIVHGGVKGMFCADDPSIHLRSPLFLCLDC